MSTTEPEDELDYEAYLHEHGPDPTKVRRGRQALEALRKAAAVKQRITIRIDQDIVEEFKALAPEGRGYQGLMNQALRDWLVARGVKELIHRELADTVREALSRGSAAGP